MPESVLCPQTQIWDLWHKTERIQYPSYHTKTAGFHAPKTGFTLKRVLISLSLKIIIAFKVDAEIVCVCVCVCEHTHVCTSKKERVSKTITSEVTSNSPLPTPPPPTPPPFHAYNMTQRLNVCKSLSVCCRIPGQAISFLTDVPLPSMNIKTYCTWQIPNERSGNFLFLFHFALGEMSCETTSKDKHCTEEEEDICYTSRLNNKRQSNLCSCNTVYPRVSVKKIYNIYLKSENAGNFQNKQKAVENHT